MCFTLLNSLGSGRLACRLFREPQAKPNSEQAGMGIFHKRKIQNTATCAVDG
jgi:hypothetical protein